MSAISFGKINKSLLFILLMSISMVINQYIYGFTYIECFYKMNIYQSLYNAIIDKNKKYFPRHRIFDPLFSYVGVILLSLFIPKPKEKKEENNGAISVDNGDEFSQIKKLFQFYSFSSLRLIHNKNNYLKKKKGIINFILILILWIAEENLVLIYVDIFQDLDFWFFELIIVSLVFSKYFYFELYQHQKLAMALSIGVGSILKIYNITISLVAKEDKIYKKYPYVFSFIILYFLIITARSYVNTKIKVFMDLKFISHRTLLMFYGLTGAVICSIVGIGITFVPCPNNNLMKAYVCKIKKDETKIYYDNMYLYYESSKNMLVRLIIIVLGMVSFYFNKFFTTLIIKSYTPIHVIFSFPMQFFIEKTFLLIFTAIFFVKDLFKTKEQLKKFLLDESGDIASILGFLIYLEIIELNFCNLNFNLKKNIAYRSELEYNISHELEEIKEIEEKNEDSSEDSDDV